MKGPLLGLFICKEYSKIKFYKKIEMYLRYNK
ncbi:hypothetical protein QO009_003805 [Brevibacillus aydinogluensis]|nr:hypothetical protein [Brevibacillus aydinogluensis]